MRPTSSSRSARRSPEFLDEPFFQGARGGKPPALRVLASGLEQLVETAVPQRRHLRRAVEHPQLLEGVGHPLYTHPRVRLTPHISWAAGEVQAATADKFIAQLTRYLQGEPLTDLVDAQRGY